jgi:mRNA interferase RelE/StbE
MVKNTYIINIRETAIKKLKSFSNEEKIRFIKKIEELGENPFEMPNVKRLVDFDISYRLRVGDYRILFDRDDTNKSINIFDIRHRKDTYRRH